MTGHHIRRATIEDGPAMAAIINDWIDDTEWMPRIHSREAIAGFFDEALFDRRVIFVGEMAGKIDGYLSLKPEGMIAAIYLAKEARGQGLGSKLIDAAKALHPEGLELGVLEPNINAKRFYEREGFVEVPEGRVTDTDEGVPELLMRWVPNIKVHAA
jgi:putative acetyltransferase